MRLLDLTRRNPQLNFKERRRDIRVIDELPNPTFGALLGGQELLLEPTTADLFDSKEGTDVGSSSAALPRPGEHLASNHVDDQLQTVHAARELERRARNLHAAARTALEETGANFLYLAMGFLEWYESGHSDVKCRAPLLLLPIELKKGKFETDTDTFRYSISYLDEDIESNLSLAEKLKEFHYELPLFEEERTPEDYFSRVAGAIAGAHRWSVVREMVIGLFSFSKILMYRDLDGTRWPEGGKPAEHAGVSSILVGTDSQDGPSGYAPGEVYALDCDARSEKIPLVVDADSSQHSALIDAVVEEKNLALHGPPGTGKSQTITNLIASCLSAGKAVLFVAEKRAALEVVRKNLDACGLGDFVLELHSHRTNKGQLHRDLERRLTRRFPAPRDIEGRKEELLAEKRRLQEYSAAATAAIAPDGVPFYEAVWRAGRLRSELPDALTRVDLGPLPSLPRAQRRELASLAKEYAEHWISLSELARDAWEGMDLHGSSSLEYPRVLKAVADLSIATQELQREIEACSREGIPLSASLQEACWLERVLRVLAETPAPSASTACWRPMASASARQAVRGLAAALSVREGLEQGFAVLRATTVYGERKLTERLRESCERLVSLGVGDQSLKQLEIHLSDCIALRDATKGVAEMEPEASSLLGRTASYLGDYESCTRLAALFGQVPLLARTCPDLNWFSQELQAVIAQKRSECDRIRSRSSEVPEIPLDRFASTAELQQITSLLRTLRPKHFKRYRAAYRKAKKVLQAKDLDPRLLLRERALEDFELAAHVLEEHKAFEVDAVARRDLKGAFCGLETNWAELEQACRWTKDVEQAAGGVFLARTLARRSDDTGRISDRVAARVAGHLRTISERLPRAFVGEEHLETPVRKIAGLATGRVVLLEEALAHLRDAQVTERATAAEVRAAADAHLKWLRVSEEIEGRTDLPGILGGCWQGVKTDAGLLLLVADYVEGLLEQGIPEKILMWALEGDEGLRLVRLLQPARTALRLREAREALSSVVAQMGNLDFERWLGSPGEPASLALLTSACEACLASREVLGSWAAICRVRKSLHENGLGLLTDTAKSLAPRDVEMLVLAHLQDRVVQAALLGDSCLKSFTRQRYQGIQERFSALDKSITKLQCEAIAARAAERSVPGGNGRGPVREWSQLHLLQHELTKKKRHIPIRQLVRRAGQALQALKPCFMMSPMSVAQYLEAGALQFDLVVMDEASQMRTEDALGAVLRANRCVIVGDPKQLPPTAFFDKLDEEKDEQEEQEEVAAEQSESILDVAQRVFPNRMLEWHYRSKHESLIAFSNAQFYDGRLLVFPSPHASVDEYGVKRHFVTDGHYHDQRNLKEAREVALAVRDHLLQRPEESLGVATFNAQQRDLIIGEIERLQKEDAELDRLLRRHDEEQLLEPFFVKNLENVQGDEREVIFISTTYGPDATTGRVYQRFGPITGAKGWRRLNVIFTRARKRVVLFTSLRSEDVIPSDSRSQGVLALHNYLKYAETGIIPDHGRRSGRPPDSDFEVDVARVLGRHGFEVEPQVGVAGYFIDVGVRDPRGTGRYVLGVECDGASYHSARSVRDRDRLRQEVLERKGWALHRIWSTDWFNNRDAETDRLVKAVEAAARRIEPL